jgi:hypothetical protein
MFHHVTLIQFRRDAPLEALAKAVRDGRELQAQIPSIASMSCGEAKPGPGDYNLAYHFAFEDEAGFGAFASHSCHEEYVENCVHPWAAQVLSVDYDDGLPV